MNKKKSLSVDQILIPVEYRELWHPAKTQAQGIAEMWVEIYSVEEARKIPIQKMQTINRETYEIRLIVWETRDVPLVDGDNVDTWVRVTFDPTGWADDEVEKRTDVHNNSKTGWGEFNWRFKFDLAVPCDFPRIKFTIHDEGVFTDEAIGEATLNLKGTISKL
jgi:fer-1-like protein 6